jgi:hypothetical protein
VNFYLAPVPVCLNVNALFEFIAAPSCAAVVEASLPAAMITAHTPAVVS